VVPPQDVARLLQPFQRIGAESTDHGDGLGLGLAIVQAIANGHGANLSCRAQEQGGLHIDVGFPAQSERLAPRVAPGPGPRTAPTLPRLHSGDGRIAHPSVTLGDTEVEDRP
jgi:hypothetical protein